MNVKQVDTLNEIYYGQIAAGSIGMRAMWELLRSSPVQQGPNRITWRGMREWMSKQKSNTLFRRAPTQHVKRGGLPTRLEFLSQLQVDFLDTGKQAFGGYRYIMVVVDTFTRMLWTCTFRHATLNQDRSVRCMKNILDSIRQLFGGGWPTLSNTSRTQIKSDNGAEFGADWKREIEAYAPVKVVYGTPSNPNDQALAENAVGRIRTRLRGYRELYDKNFARYLDRLVAGLNQTPQGPLGYKTPADMLEAVIEREDDDLAMLDAVRARQRGRASAARGATRVKERPLTVGQRVRLLDLAYVKAGKSRGNTFKFRNRWTRTIYNVLRVRKVGDSRYTYSISNGKPAYYTRQMLQVITRGAQEDAPAAVLAAPDSYTIFKILDRRPGGQWLVAYTGYGQPELVPTADVPQNLRAAYIAAGG